MSLNQPRSDKGDSQNRRSGRSGSFSQQRSSSGCHGKGAGGGPAPSPSLSSNRSFKRFNNAQGSQSRVNSAAVGSSASGNASAARDVQNGAHVQSHSQRASDAPVAGNATKTVESSTAQRSTRAVPKAPTSLSSAMNSEGVAPSTPLKGPGDASKQFSFQFGTLSPGLMNGMQIPARTSSAPPNLDEQKRDQARRDSAYKSGPNLPIPVAKAQLPSKDSAMVDQSNSAGAHAVLKVKKDAQVPTVPLSNQTQKPPVLPVPITSMQMPFHQPPVSVQFGVPNPALQTQNVTGTSLQMPVPMALPQVQQQVFVPGLQHHPIPPQGMMHQGQGMSFTTPMGPHQLGNLGIGISPPYPQQQGGKFGGPRKTTTVKITHPETHEELRLDKRTDSYPDGGSSGPRSHPNVPSQSQPIPSYTTSHPINYYPNSYSANSMFYPPPSSNIPLSSNQNMPNAQAPRFNYSVSQGPQHGRDVRNMTSTPNSGVAQVTVRPAIGSNAENINDSSLSNTVSAIGSPKSSTLSDHTLPKSHQNLDGSQCNLQQPRPADEASVSGLLSSASTAVPEEPAPVSSCNDDRRKESLSRSNSMKDHQKKMGKRGHVPTQNQVGDQSTSTQNLALHTCEPGMPSEDVSEAVEVKKAVTSSATDVPSQSIVETITDVPSTASELKMGGNREGIASILSISGGGVVADTLDTCAMVCRSLTEGEHPKQAISESEGQNGTMMTQRLCQEEENVEIPAQPVTFKTEDITTLSEQESVLKANDTSSEVPVLGTSQGGFSAEVSAAEISDLAAGSHSDTSQSVIGSNEASSGEPGLAERQSAPSQTPDLTESNLRNEGEDVPLVSPKDKPFVEMSKAKSSTTRGKKKRKEVLQKADAAGTTADLYMAYKGPEEKKEMVVPSESMESNSTGSTLKEASPAATQMETTATEKIAHTKAEPDDWEDAADISTPKLESSENIGEGSCCGHDGNQNSAKKYSRDFLLKFAEQCTDLPAGFDKTIDLVVGGTVPSSHVVDRDYGPGRIDRQSSGSRMDRRGSGVVDDDRWSKLPGPFGPGRDLRLDLGYTGFRPGQAGNYGVLRHPRPQTPMPYGGGILSGPMHSVGPQGLQRNMSDNDRWQRATNFQHKGLIPSPTTPLQMMHKAERKYQVGKVTDEEQAKQRQLKGILNKLTPQNFDKLLQQVKAVNIDSATTLTSVISQIFDKALMEPTFCEMYANFCYHLAGELPDFSDENEKITFKRHLLNKCQEEFERGDREQEEANKAEEEGEAKQSEEEREEKRIKARRRMLGNIRLIGELYKKKMLTDKIMHECINKLLGQLQNPDEEDLEALCKLMSTIGEMIDHPRAKGSMNAYFDRMTELSNNMNLSSRVRFMLKDVIDLRKNKWQQRRKVEGPKKIEEVHRDAAQERQTQSSRLSRGPGINPAGRRAPMDFSPRGSQMLSPPGAQMGSFRGLSRGYGTQDIRVEERQSFEARTLSVPLPQGSIGEDSITLGPQGGLARGMSFRGPTAMSTASVLEVSSTSGDSRRGTAGLNGFSSVSERATYIPREDISTRYASDKGAGPVAHEQLHERSANHGNRDMRYQDRNFDRPHVTAAPSRVQTSNAAQHLPPDKILSEEKLHGMSMAAIKEFYSARDEKEVALCIKDLNSPGFHSSMIALWVTDSFERKDVERDLLAKLLVNLTRSQDGLLSQGQLMKGFESVLGTLEDAVSDAPKAPEYLGRIFGKGIVENVLSLKEVGHLIYVGGEEPGCLRDVGLAGDVLGSTLEMIKTDKGETVLTEIIASSELLLEDFRPPDPYKSKILEKFI